MGDVTRLERRRRLLEEILADEREQAVFVEASRRLRDAHTVEFETLLEQVRGEVAS